MQPDEAGDDEHGNYADRPDHEALRGVAERPLSRHAVKGGAAQSAGEISSGGEAEGLGQHKPHRGGHGEPGRRDARAVRQSKRQPDAGSQRRNDECNRYCRDRPRNRGAPGEGRSGRTLGSRHFNNCRVAHTTSFPCEPLCSQGVLPPIIGDQTTKARIFSSTIAESGNQIGSCRDDDRGTVLRIFQQETLDEKVEPRRTFRFP